jgi:hypothetical protein
MARDPFARDDDTGIAEWLAWKRGIKPSAEPASAHSPSPATIAPPDPNQPLQAPVTADGVPDYRDCQGCGRRLSKMGIGRTRCKLYCSPACRKRAWRKRHGRPSYEGPVRKPRRVTPNP